MLKKIKIIDSTSVLTTVVAVYAGHLAFPLLRGVGKILPQMRTLTFWSTFLAFLAIATVNLAYMRYRAGMDFGGAHAWLKENTPLGQYVLMEYHEFSVLFTLPLGAACTWILWQYGDSILEKQNRPVLSVSLFTTDVRSDRNDENAQLRLGFSRSFRPMYCHLSYRHEAS